MASAQPWSAQTRNKLQHSGIDRFPKTGTLRRLNDPVLKSKLPSIDLKIGKVQTFDLGPGKGQLAVER